MTEAEHRLLFHALAWILASVPLAVLGWQVWFRPRRVHAVIPHEDAMPAGTFLDVALPPALPPELEKGLPVRHWKQADGWVALVAVVVLSLLMGPLSMDPESVENFKLSAAAMGVQLIFQVGLAGLLLFYLVVARGFNLTTLFGLRRQPLLMVPVWAVAWIVPGAIILMVIINLTMPWVLRLLGQDAATPQMMITALQDHPDALTKAAVLLTVGVGAPFMEELVFRGFLYGVAKRFTHWSYAAVASAMFFAIVHGNVMSFLPLTLLGLLFTAAYERTQNLLVPMFMHGMFNICQVLLIFYVPQIAQQLDK